MPIPITYYKCSICGKLYNEYKRAKDCEDKKNKCLSCANGYYVYGCEFNCKHSTECSFMNHYSYYKPKKENSND